MQFSTGDIISIVIFLIGFIGTYINQRISNISIQKDFEKDQALMKQEISALKTTSAEKDIKFEKVLEKLEMAIEKLNDTQIELSKSIYELRTEIKNKD